MISGRRVHNDLNYEFTFLETRFEEKIAMHARFMF